MNTTDYPSMKGYYVCLTMIGYLDILPDIIKGKIVSIGSSAFKGEIFNPTWKEKIFEKLVKRRIAKQSILQIGDIVYFNHLTGQIIKYKGNLFCFLTDMEASRHVGTYCECLFKRFEEEGHLIT